MWPQDAAAASGRLGPDLGLVLEDQPLDDPGGHRLVLRIEGGDGLEGQLQLGAGRSPAAARWSPPTAMMWPTG